MPQPQCVSAEIVQPGQRLYEQLSRAQVETRHAGDCLILEVETGDYGSDAAKSRSRTRLDILVTAKGCTYHGARAVRARVRHSTGRVVA